MIKIIRYQVIFVLPSYYANVSLLRRFLTVDAIVKVYTLAKAQGEHAVLSHSTLYYLALPFLSRCLPKLYGLPLSSFIGDCPRRVKGTIGRNDGRN